ncbi:MAG: transporter [Proteobacteria bacterium]|nr:transporter [Pseudomonadota bacterium]
MLENKLNLFALLLLLLSLQVNAQGAGPRTNFLTPVDNKSIAFTYLDVDSNFRFGQSDTFGKADINTQTAIVSYSQRFSLFGRFAQLGLSASYAEVGFKANPDSVEGGLTTTVLTRRGAGDPVVSFRLGLMGAPALTPEQWRGYHKGFHMYAMLGLLVPIGHYDNTRAINTGFNRWGYQLGLPMVIPLEKTRRNTFLEITPQVNIYADNTDPFGNVNRLSQDPLYSLELQASHKFTRRFWVSLGFQYQNGGRTIADGIPNDNKLDQWLGELALGYIVNARFALLGSYGKIFEQKNNARGDMLRVRLVTMF